MDTEVVEKWNFANNLARTLGFKLYVDSGEFILSMDTEKYPQYSSTNKISRFTTVAAVISYLNGWADSRLYLSLEAATAK